MGAFGKRKNKIARKQNLKPLNKENWSIIN